jgi:hypothetical protein
VNLGLVSKAFGPLLVGGMAAGATWIATGPVVGALAPEARAWIDTPLDGAVLPVGLPVEIVAHATDKDGVALVTLRVDGVEETTATGGGGSLVTVPITWKPPGKGTYELEVIGEDDQGGTGDVGAATVTIGDVPAADGTGPSSTDSTTTTAPAGPGDTTTTSATVVGGGDPSSTTSTTDPGAPTTQPSSTTTRPGASTTTSRPTTTTTTTRPTTTTTAATTTTTTAPPCQAVPPSLASPSDGATLRTSPTLSWVYQGCPIDGFRVEVRRVVANPPVITSPTLDPSARSWAPPDGFACDGRPWYWRVAALTGRDLRWSTTWSFTC